MRFIFFVLLILLIAQIGFWNTLGAVLGAVLMFVLLIPLLLGGRYPRRHPASGGIPIGHHLPKT